MERDRERKTPRVQKKERTKGRKRAVQSRRRGGRLVGRCRIPPSRMRMLIRTLQIRSSPADPADWLASCYRRGPCTCRYIGELRCHVRHLYRACIPSVPPAARTNPAVHPNAVAVQWQFSGSSVIPQADRLSRHLSRHDTGYLMLRYPLWVFPSPSLAP